MSASPSQAKLIERANDGLAKGIAALGIEVERQGSLVLCVGTPLQARCNEVVVMNDGNIVSLAIALFLGNERKSPIIRECIAGISPEFDSAFNNAIADWMLTVFVTALAWHDVDGCPAHMASCEERDFLDRKGQNRKWRIISSPLVKRGETEIAPGTLDTKETLLPLFTEMTRHTKTHWVKAFVMQSPLGNHCDCTVDNRISEKGKNLLNDSETIARPDILRQFHILVPLETEGTTGQSNPGFWSKLFGKSH